MQQSGAIVQETPPNPEERRETAAERICAMRGSIRGMRARMRGVAHASERPEATWRRRERGEKTLGRGGGGGLRAVATSRASRGGEQHEPRPEHHEAARLGDRRRGREARGRPPDVAQRVRRCVRGQRRAHGRCGGIGIAGPDRDGLRRSGEERRRDAGGEDAMEAGHVLSSATRLRELSPPARRPRARPGRPGSPPARPRAGRSARGGRRRRLRAPVHRAARTRTPRPLPRSGAGSRRPSR